MNPLTANETLTTEERDRLRKLAEEKGDAAAAKAVHLVGPTFYKALAGRPVHQSTARAIRDYFATVPRIDLAR